MTGDSNCQVWLTLSLSVNSFFSSGDSNIKNHVKHSIQLILRLNHHINRYYQRYNSVSVFARCWNYLNTWRICNDHIMSALNVVQPQYNNTSWARINTANTQGTESPIIKWLFLSLSYTHWHVKYPLLT